MPLHLKPLVERRQDIRAIAAALLLRQQANEAAFVWPTAKAMEKLMAHRWPGNARELGNVLQRALVLREGERIEADDLHITPVPVRVEESVSEPVVASAPTPWASSSATLHDVARASKLDSIHSVLDAGNGHRAPPARHPGNPGPPFPH